MSEEYLLVKRDLYWRPGGAGYTGIKDKAGRYSREDAQKMVGEGVTMVKLEDAPVFTNACFDDLARGHLIKQRDEAIAALAGVLKIIDGIDEYQNRKERGEWGVECACCMGELFDHGERPVIESARSLCANQRLGREKDASGP